jgi:Fe-S cluster biogenesis protein NfuA
MTAAEANFTGGAARSDGGAGAGTAGERLDEQAAHDLVERLESLLERLEALPNQPARTAAMDTVEALVRLYGEGLARMMDQVARSEDASIARAFTRDALVSHLLLLHCLHPDPVEKRVRRALDEVRPYLRSHGGGVELLSVAGDVARLRLTGGCESSGDALRSAVEDAVLRAAPELTCIEEEPPAEPAPVLVSLTGPRGKGASKRDADAPSRGARPSAEQSTRHPAP